LAELLPFSFGPEDLGQPAGLLAAGAARPLENLEAMELAEAAALRGWSPYSRALSGVAVRCGGRWYPGSYLENAAFNPSLNPIQYALVVAHSQGHSWSEVTEICCWERTSQVSLVPACQAVAASLPGRPPIQYG
jgi:cytidine deaminase